MIYFYDTNILLQGDKKLLNETFLISNITNLITMEGKEQKHTYKYFTNRSHLSLKGI